MSEGIGGERISVHEAAEILGVGDEAVRKAMREGRLPHHKDIQGMNMRYSTTREEVEEYKAQRGGRMVAGYSKEAMQQYRDTFGGYFRDLQSAIEESTELERERLELDRERLELDRKMMEELQGMREEVRGRIELDRELLEHQKRVATATEGMHEIKSAGEEEDEGEAQSWWSRLFGG